MRDQAWVPRRMQFAKTIKSRDPSMWLFYNSVKRRDFEGLICWEISFAESLVWSSRPCLMTPGWFLIKGNTWCWVAPKGNSFQVNRLCHVPPHRRYISPHIPFIVENVISAMGKTPDVGREILGSLWKIPALLSTPQNRADATDEMSNSAAQQAFHDICNLICPSPGLWHFTLNARGFFS